eukprot:297292-Ditylum_brightwellii.AAC.1
MDVFDNFLSRKTGVRTIPLSYVTRVTALATRLVYVHKADLPQGEAYGLIEEELVAQASHAYTFYCEDNVAVCFCLKEANRGTQYASTLKPYQQVKSSRGFWPPLNDNMLELISGRQNCPKETHSCIKQSGRSRQSTLSRGSLDITEMLALQ